MDSVNKIIYKSSGETEAPVISSISQGKGQSSVELPKTIGGKTIAEVPKNAFDESVKYIVVSEDVNVNVPSGVGKIAYGEDENGNIVIKNIVAAKDENGNNLRVSIPVTIGGSRPVMSDEAKEDMKDIPHTHHYLNGACTECGDIEKPVITEQPTDTSAKEGETAKFAVKVIGIDVTYQWQVDRNDGKGFVNLDNANSAEYTIDAADMNSNGYKYQCVISNSAGSVTTNPAILKVTKNITYSITTTAEVNGSIVIRGNGELSKFQSVKVDGMVIDAVNYTATEGSTIITLKADYIKTLSDGSHSFEIVWTDGSASTSFTIVKDTLDDSEDDDNEDDLEDAKVDNHNVKVPLTGDNFNPALWITLFVMSVTGLSVMLIKDRRKV